MITYQVSATGELERFVLKNHRPEGAIGPETEGYMTYTPGKGFAVTMRCFEENPKITYTQPDDPVFKDSCMEVFLDCYPELPEYGYMNIEINAAGAMRCRFGKNRQDRFFLLERGIPQPQVTVTKEEHFWQINLEIPETVLEQIYERPCRFAPGHQMRGNFYKCGDETATPHWSSWVEMPRLDFHLPEHFGVLEIK